MNVVMTESGEFIEVQGTAEGARSGGPHLDELLELAESGIGRSRRQSGMLATPPCPVCPDAVVGGSRGGHRRHHPDKLAEIAARGRRVGSTSCRVRSTWPMSSRTLPT